MNDIISLKRLSLSLRRIMIEKGIKMFGSILIFIFITLLFMNLELDPGFYLEIRVIFLVMGMMFGPILYVSVLANEFTNQSKGISYLLMPNSTFEKWLINNVIVIVLFYVIYGLLFRLVDGWMVGRLVEMFQIPEGNLTVIPFNSDVFISTALAGITISIGIILGSHYFSKNNLIISLLIMFAGFIALLIIDYIAANIMFEPHIFFFETSPFGSVQVIDETTAGGTYFVSNDLTLLQLASWFFTPVILLLSLTYFVRIKEKQL